jgi:hypothetical protein
MRNILGSILTMLVPGRCPGHIGRFSFVMAMTERDQGM